MNPAGPARLNCSSVITEPEQRGMAFAAYARSEAMSADCAEAQRGKRATRVARRNRFIDCPEEFRISNVEFRMLNEESSADHSQFFIRNSKFEIHCALTVLYPRSIHPLIPPATCTTLRKPATVRSLAASAPSVEVSPYTSTVWF